MFDRFTDVLDTFSKYDNLLGFLVDNVLSGCKFSGLTYNRSGNLLMQIIYSGGA